MANDGEDDGGDSTSREVIESGVAATIEAMDASARADAGLLQPPVSDGGGANDDAAAETGAPETGAAPDAEAGPGCISQAEVCNGKDDDCDGEADEQVKIRCWADIDSDGFAAQGATVVESCDQCSAQQTSVAPVAGKTDCDDADPKRSPGATDLCGDSIDNDCDGVTDDETNNACGGPCTTRLPGRPADPCSNGLKGACARTGVYECTTDHGLRCTALAASPSAEVCGDNSDNDCDGTVDNGCVRNACGGWSTLANAKGSACTAGTGSCAVNGTYVCMGTDATNCSATPRAATTWYLDCDKDGFAANFAGQVESCGRPALSSSCDWTATSPTGSNVDCDANNARRYPGAGYGVTGGGAADLDCSGVVSQFFEFVSSPDGQFHSAITYTPCTKPVGTLSPGECNSWVAQYLVTGYRGVKADGTLDYEKATMWTGSVKVDEFTPPPCASSSSDVILAARLKWTDRGCFVDTTTPVVLRVICK